MKYQVIIKDGRVKRTRMGTVHGTVETPAFMSVGAVGAIKEAVSTDNLREIGTQVELSNTYHLHAYIGDKLIKEFGGLHRFMNRDRPIPTDSGGSQVFSLAGLHKIKEEGVYLNSHIDSHEIFMGPEEGMRIQSNLGSTAATAFDKRPPSHASDDYTRHSVERTTRWLACCKTEMERLSSLPGMANRGQLLFDINQGGAVEGICMEHVRTIREVDLDGYAVGGLAVGESRKGTYHILDVAVPCLPEDKPVYLMGVGTLANILEAVDRGVDSFDCVYPSRNGRHGHVYTNQGRLNLFNQKYELDSRPIEEGRGRPACHSHGRAYIRHLLKAKEILGTRLCTLHSLHFYNTMMKKIRDAIEEHRYAEYKATKLASMEGSSRVTGMTSGE